MSQQDTFSQAVEKLALALLPLRNAISSPERFVSFMAQMGWQVDSVPEPLVSLGSGLGELITTLQRIISTEQSGADINLADVDALLQSVQDIFHGIEAIRTAPDAAFPPSLIADNFKTEFPAQLVQFLVITHLTRLHPRLAFVLRALGVIRISYVPAAGNRRPYMRYRIDFSDLPRVLEDPSLIFTNAYGWGTDSLDYETLFQHLENLLLSLEVDVARPILRRETANVLAGGIESPGQPDRRPVAAVFFERIRDNGRLAAELLFLDLPGDANVKPGLALVPRFNGPLDFRLQLGTNIAVTISSTLDLQGGVGVTLRPGRGIDVIAGFEGGNAPTSAKGSVSVRAEYSDESQEPTVLLGSPDATRLEFKNVSGTGGLSFNSTTSSQDLFVELDLQGGTLVIAAGEGDGFLQTILPKDGIGLAFDLTAGLSLARGFYFRGSAGLQLNIPTHIRLGPVELQSLTIAAQPKDGTIPISLGATVKAEIGPVTAVVENLGLRATFSFPDGGGNIGPLDLAVGFKPPKGAGLSIDAQVVVGGGYLSFDPEKEEYSGILELEIAEKISVKAIGMLTTRLPDGRSGFSLVAIIFVEGFAPIQLGFGFALTGIGGLIGINRTFDETVLRGGLKNHTLDSVMFPKDPIRNAPQIVSNLNRVFPPTRGNHLFGPVLQISWGTPALITANVAVVFEIGARRRLLILAQIAAILPRPENDLVRLQMDAVGVVDFDQGTASLDASLHDSRLLKKFTLTGDMGMRMNWQGSPNFALAVGGLHPAFNPPPGFPKLERIAINLSSGDNPRFRCEAYYAITSNTVQFGARAELFAKAAGFSIQGEVAYDVLIQMDPFMFLAEFHAQLQLKRGSTNLFKVRLEGSLGGPRPLHIKGKATFEILWWDVSIRFDKTLVEGEKPPGPEPVAVLPRLMEALGNEGNWVSQLPGGQRQAVRLRGRTAAPGEVYLHPLGSLTVKQNVVPLEIDITRFGQGAPTGERRFTISSVTVGSNQESKGGVRDFFAPGQYFEMSDEEKLSRPSFELMTAGVAIAANEITFTGATEDVLEVKAIEFETTLIGKDVAQAGGVGTEEGKKLYRLSVGLLEKQSGYGAAAKSGVRRTGNAKYRLNVVKNKIVKEGWSIVATEDLGVQAVEERGGAKEMSYTEAEEALRRIKEQEPGRAGSLKILRLSEVS
jgi:Family of unknown function (DUF6603)